MAEKYAATVTAIGEFASAFIEEGVLVFFATNAPEELQEHAVVHDRVTPQSADVRVGDIVHLDGQSFPVLAVGDVANENLANLGHLVLKFNGLEEPEMQGDVNLPEQAIPDLKPGSVLRITDTKG